MKRKIERGIPIPGHHPGQLKIFDNMEYGDSFLTTEERKDSYYSSFYYLTKIKGITVDYILLTRKVEGGFRIWKVKKEEHES